MLGPRSVHKFGGTSVQSASAMHQVRQIIEHLAREQGSDSPLAVVVSAMGGKPKTTDMLIDSTKAASRGDLAGAQELLVAIKKKHEEAIERMIPDEAHAAARAELVRVLNGDLDDIRHLLRAVSLMRSADQKLVGVISGYGEQWSARMMAALLRATSTPPAADNWVYLDARAVLIVDDTIATGTAIQWDASEARLKAFVEAHPRASFVITGFIASTVDGGITTLGRDGSDYSASVFARLLQAEACVIWTDVSGVLSADPRVVADAYVLPEVSYNEAAELAHFGAKVVHPKTMQPALARHDWRAGAKSIPIYIRNTFAPADAGTRIFETSDLTRAREVCGVSAMRGMCLINVMGRGMVGIPGVSSRLFSALHSLSINVTAIAQASSEQSISVALVKEDGERARAAVLDVFRSELSAGHIEDVQLEDDVTIIAVVGDGMSHRPGVAGKVMGALGHAGVNIRAIAQGCNETNITTIVDGAHSLRALRAVHAAFLASLAVAVGVVTRSSAVADSLLAAFDAHAPTTEHRFGLTARVHALLQLPGAGSGASGGALEEAAMKRNASSSSGKMLFARASSALDIAQWRAEMSSEGQPVDLSAFTQRMLQSDVPMRVVVDASDSPDAAAWHAKWLSEGIHVVTNNSTALTGDVASYRALFDARRNSTARYVYGTAYGDWLPVASTVTTLLASGDAVKSLEGALSASVSYVLNRVSPVGQLVAAGGETPPTFSQVRARPARRRCRRASRARSAAAPGARRLAPA